MTMLTYDVCVVDGARRSLIPTAAGTRLQTTASPQIYTLVVTSLHVTISSCQVSLLLPPILVSLDVPHFFNRSFLYFYMESTSTYCFVSHFSQLIYHSRHHHSRPLGAYTLFHSSEKKTFSRNPPHHRPRPPIGLPSETLDCSRIFLF